MLDQKVASKFPTTEHPRSRGKAGPPRKPPPDPKTRGPALSGRKRRANPSSNFEPRRRSKVQDVAGEPSP
jgi:hypothetical protein